MPRTTWTLALALLLASGTLGRTPASAARPERGRLAGDDDKKAKKEDRPTVDSTQVYYGNPKTTKKPAVVDADRVYAAIPEYKKIVDDGLKETDPRYSVLMLKATRKFKAAVKQAAKDAGNDLVANVGAVTWEGHEIPDLTDEALEAAEEQEK